MTPERIAEAESQISFSRAMGGSPPKWALETLEHRNDPPMTISEASDVLQASIFGRAHDAGEVAEAHAVVKAVAPYQREFEAVMGEIATLAESKLGMVSWNARSHARSEAMAAQESANTYAEAVANLRARRDQLKGGSGARTILAERRTVTQSRPRILESALATSQRKGLLSVCLITAGQGSSGQYPVETLRKAAEAKVFHAGLHVYIDHPTATEQYDRPERSVRDLAGALATDAVYRDGGLYAEASIFSNFWDLVVERAGAIGMSIRAQGVINNGIVEELSSADSVDFVTRAGRGGRILTTP